MRNPRLLPSVCALGLALSLHARAEARDAGPLSQVTECLEHNIPQKTSEQVVEFTSVDRIGGERVSRAKITGKRFDDGLRRVLLRFTKPLEMRGAALLIIETESGANDMFLYSPEFRKVKRVTGESSGGNLFGTDFSYEDFERWQLLNRPGQQKRLPDAVIAERPVYVLETVPEAESGSSYESILSYVDQDTCVVLKIESFEKGHRLRKVFTAEPDTILKEGGIHVASEALMQDVRDETRTSVIVEEIEVDHEVADREFTISRLSRRR